MEPRIEGEEESHGFYGNSGKRSVEWDLNDWRWDGDLFLARQLNHGSSNSSSSCSDERNVEIMEKMKKKKRVVEEVNLRDENDDDDGHRLTLKLGGLNCDNSDGNGAKKPEFGGGMPNRAVCCQVENCGADLSKAKDYHRRHKVCEMHSKSTSAVVGGVMQRFCQQCSR